MNREAAWAGGKNVESSLRQKAWGQIPALTLGNCELENWLLILYPGSQKTGLIVLHDSWRKVVLESQDCISVP